MRPIIPSTDGIPLHHLAVCLEDFGLDPAAVGTSPDENPWPWITASELEGPSQLTVNQIHKLTATVSQERTAHHPHLGQL